MNKFIKDFSEALTLGNPSVINSENTNILNQIALDLYNKPELNQDEIEDLKNIIMSCNILYNMTDMEVLPISDGFYDLLLEKYKKYDKNFQVGSAIVEFQSLLENDIENPRKVATCPVYFSQIPKKNDVESYVYNKVNNNGIPYLDRNDMLITSPVDWDPGYISKGLHNTEHNHPSLVGTLDKAKFVLNNDAIKAGCFDDPNVAVLERDFFQAHIKKGIIDPNQEIWVVCELKYDGISVEADCGTEVFSARTRGDTGIGQAVDLTPLLKGYPFVHARAMNGEKPIGVKFEAIMTKSNLERFNRIRNCKYANCRTAMIGLQGASDGYLYRDLITLVPLAIDRDDVPQISNRIEEIEFMNMLFQSHGEPLRYCIFSGNYAQVLYQIKIFLMQAAELRDTMNFMYDGIVVSYIDENIRKKLGRENYINKYSMAVKFDPITKVTTFRGYTYEVGQNGQITPMIHYDPVEFIGTIHTKSTGSSYARFKELGLKYGDYISVKYTNDVMPYVSKLECEHNDNNPNPEIEFIDHCPVCGAPLLISDSGKMKVCPNLECPARSISRMTNMMQKMNLKGIAEATFRLIPHIDHFYKLFKYNEDYYIERLGNADGRLLYKFIHEDMINMKDYIAVGSLGFSGIAHKKWKSILEQIKLMDIYKIYYQLKDAYKDFDITDAFRYRLIEAIPNIGEVTASVIAKEFPFFELDIKELLEIGVIDSYGTSSDSKLQIRFTGCRNLQLSELLGNLGYDADPNGSVSSKTDILIIPFDGYTSNKTRKISDRCLKVTLQEFQNNMDNILNQSLMTKNQL